MTFDFLVSSREYFNRKHDFEGKCGFIGGFDEKKIQEFNPFWVEKMKYEQIFTKKKEIV